MVVVGSFGSRFRTSDVGEEHEGVFPYDWLGLVWLGLATDRYMGEKRGAVVCLRSFWSYFNFLLLPSFLPPLPFYAMRKGMN